MPSPTSARTWPPTAPTWRWTRPVSPSSRSGGPQKGPPRSSARVVLGVLLMTVLAVVPLWLDHDGMPG